MAYIISKQILKDKLDFNEEELILLYSVFLKNTRENLIKLKNAIENNDYNCIHTSANNIKGSSANLLIDDVYDITKELELASKSEEKIDYLSKYEELDTIFSSLTLE